MLRDAEIFEEIKRMLKRNSGQYYEIAN